MQPGIWGKKANASIAGNTDQCLNLITMRISHVLDSPNITRTACHSHGKTAPCLIGAVFYKSHLSVIQAYKPIRCNTEACGQRQ